MSNLPVPPTDPPPPAHPSLDRAALERVLARAAELQAAAADAPEVLTEEQLVELGQEVGLSAQHLRQAIAEERTRVALPEEPGLAAQVAGPSVASASRVVRGMPADALAAIDAWMQREECLQVRRRFGDRITWEPRRDFWSSYRRAFNLGGRGYHLTRAREVAATAVPVDEQRVLVRLDVDLSDVRRRRLVGAGATAAAGTAAGGAFTLLHFVAIDALFVPIIGTAALITAGGLGAGYRIAKGHSSIVSRTQLALDQVLDRLEHGELRAATPTLLEVLGSVTRPRR